MTQIYTAGWTCACPSTSLKRIFLSKKVCLTFQGEKFIGVGLDVTATSVKQLFPEKYEMP